MVGGDSDTNSSSGGEEGGDVQSADYNNVDSGFDGFDSGGFDSF
jgi:hypothetical protein